MSRQLTLEQCWITPRHCDPFVVTESMSESDSDATLEMPSPLKGLQLKLTMVLVADHEDQHSFEYAQIDC